MNSKEKPLKESVELLKLKADRLIENGGLLLKEDIWGRGTLVLKSGTYLTEDIINKLPNFGINEVETASEEEMIEDVIPEINENDEYFVKQFMTAQNVLIVEKNLLEASSVVKPLIDAGFKEGNIFVTREPSTINGYFRVKKFNFLFINQDLYKTAAKCVEKFGLLKNTHVFVISDTNNLSALNKSKDSKIKFIYKDIAEEKLHRHVLQALYQDFSEFRNQENQEEALIS